MSLENFYAEQGRWKKNEYRKQMMVLENKQYEKNVNMFPNNNNSEEMCISNFCWSCNKSFFLFISRG